MEGDQVTRWLGGPLHRRPARDVVAATRWSDRTMWFANGRTQVQRRCSAAHELQHVLRGPGGLGPREELEVDKAAARELVALDDLVDVLRWTSRMSEAADELHVTPKILGVRLTYLSAQERAFLEERLGS